MWAGHPDGFLQVNTLLLYTSLSPYSQTDGQTDRQTDGGTTTLALRGLEEPAHALRGLEERKLIQKSLSFSDKHSFTLSFS